MTLQIRYIWVFYYGGRYEQPNFVTIGVISSLTMLALMQCWAEFPLS